MRSGFGNVVMPDKAVIMMAVAAVAADFNPAKMHAGSFLNDMGANLLDGFDMISGMAQT